MDLNTLIRCPECGTVAVLGDYDVGLADEGNVFCNVPGCHSEIEVEANVVPGEVSGDGQMELF